MKRENEITEIIHRAYDELKELGCFRNNGSLAIVPGVFIDPGIGSAEVQKIVSFVHGYEGNPDDCIISVSDVYCQKIWVVCYVSAKLLIEGGYFTAEGNSVACTDKYFLSDDSKTKMFEECAKYMEAKKKYLKKGIEDISDNLIKQLLEYEDPDNNNSNLKYGAAQWIASYAIKMLMLHEYSHILKNDPVSAPLHERIANEKRADLDAFSDLIQKDPSLLSKLGALCLQSSGLFIDPRIEAFAHPDVDERIEYVFSYFPKEGEEGNIFRDILELYVYLWSVLNDREEDFGKIGQICSSDSLFEFLKKEKKGQNDRLLEEGRAENARRKQNSSIGKRTKLPD